MKQEKSFKIICISKFYTFKPKLLLLKLLKPFRESFQSVRQRACSFEKVLPAPVRIILKNEFKQENLNENNRRILSSGAFKRAPIYY